MTAAKKEEAWPWKTSTSSGHITNPKQSILEAFDIYALDHIYRVMVIQKNSRAAWAAIGSFGRKVSVGDIFSPSSYIEMRYYQGVLTEGKNLYS
jgi:hypothetical protein